MEEDHFVSDWKVIRQTFATLDQHGVDTIQVLIAEKGILLPVVLNIVWNKSETLLFS